ncbi:benzoate 1,2-dioxygenase electron transfer component BenC [Kocuria palustris]|uniref:benzoate 1,2-dioxygenase electron transfer component BenC n=1 Tax=Kocuria palustris TaxID=71999 RepID=UPI00195DE1DC|nr:benzoate 1,2-dioxygenase electron transfer component BenC [Kocuria palustris]MBM7822713.1 benzoate/toluate 1,2-dioxygenase reductase subunit [Kocuria palustris]
MPNQVALNFEDGVTKVIKVGDMETIMDAAFKARINIPSDCRDGACGTCKSFCESGEFDPGDFIDDAMTEDELEKGYLLTCQSTPESDMSINIPSTSEVAKTSAVTFNGKVDMIERHSDSTISFGIDIPNRDELSFLPGQYVNIKVPGTDEVRSYSMSSGPNTDETAFMVRISEKGAMSEYLRDRAQEGDEIEFSGPFGSFFLREPKRRLLLLAGGTGLAPLLSILEKLAESGTDQPVHLIYGVTREADIVGLDLLKAYEDRLSDFTWDYIASEEGTSAPHTGYVTQITEPEHLNEGDVDIYLCGPPPMVNAVSSWLDEKQVNPANFYFERFAPKGTTGGDDETGAPVSPDEVDSSTSAEQAVSSMETGVLKFGKVDTAAHLDARAGLETAAARLLIGKLTEEQLDNWGRLADKCDGTVEDGKLVDYEAFVAANYDFHEYPFTVADNPALLAAYQGLDTPSHMREALENGGVIFETVTQEHHDLVELMRAGELEKTLELIQSHTVQAKQTMDTAVDAHETSADEKPETAAGADS